MANQSRAFRMPQNMKFEDIVKSVESFLNVEKMMETQSSPTKDGFVL